MHNKLMIKIFISIVVISLNGCDYNGNLFGLFHPARGTSENPLVLNSDGAAAVASGDYESAKTYYEATLATFGETELSDLAGGEKELYEEALAGQTLAIIKLNPEFDMSTVMSEMMMASIGGEVDSSVFEETVVLPETDEAAIAKKAILDVIITNYKNLIDNGDTYSDNSNIKIILGIYIEENILMTTIAEDYIEIIGTESDYTDFYIIMESTAPRKLLSAMLYEVANATQTFAQTKADMGSEKVSDMITLLENNNTSFNEASNYITDGGKNLPDGILDGITEQFDTLQDNFNTLLDALKS